MATFRLSALAAAFVMAAGMGASAAEVEFSYTYGSQDMDSIGTGKAEVYDVAIRLNDASLTGSKIKAFSVPITDSSDITDVKVWATKELKLEKKVNVPDILSVDAIVENGKISVSFPDMIEIPAEGVYVGYTFTTTSSKDDEVKYPVVVAGEPVEDGLYMHTNRSYLKWKSYAASFGHSSAITVTLEGDFQANAIGISSVKDPYATPGEEVNILAKVINHGSEPLESIEYTVTDINGTQTNNLTFSPAMNLMFGQPFSVELPYVVPTELDEFPLEITITKVNGDENKDLAKSSNALLLVFNEVPVRRPLMEEYTGLWCGFCPRGFAAMEAMNSRYPGEFVAISYHNGDAMERISSGNFPSPIGGYPSAWMDRLYEVDPYLGYSDSDFGIEPIWLELRDQFTPAIVNGAAYMLEDGSIEVKSNISFAKSVSGEYRVAYAIIADGLSDEAWAQANNFSGADPSKWIPEMAQFCEGKSSMKGLVFNDVFAAGSNLFGEPDSEIKDVVKDNVYTHSYSFTSDAGVSLRGYDMFANAKELYAVIILLDEQGAVVNCNKVLVLDPNGVNSVATGNAVATEYYDLSGRKVVNPSNGLYIKVDTKEDGTKASSKIRVR